MTRSVVQIRLKPGEKEALAAEAARAGVSVSELLRSRALGVERAAVSCGGASPPVEFRCPQGSCGFRCGSGSGRCPVHGRKVVRDG